MKVRASHVNTWGRMFPVKAAASAESRKRQAQRGKVVQSTSWSAFVAMVRTLAFSPRETRGHSRGLSRRVT